MKLVLEIDTENSKSVVEAYVVMSELRRMLKTLPEENVQMIKKVEQFFDSKYESKAILFKQIVDELSEFYYNTNPQTLKKMVIRKMTSGSIEHGVPPTDLELIESEKRQEMIDLIGWTFVKMNTLGQLK